MKTVSIFLIFERKYALKDVMENPRNDFWNKILRYPLKKEIRSTVFEEKNCEKNSLNKNLLKLLSALGFLAIVSENFHNIDV